MTATRTPTFYLEVCLDEPDSPVVAVPLGTELVPAIERMLSRDMVTPGDYPVLACDNPGPFGQADDWGLLRIYGPHRWLLRDLGALCVVVPGFATQPSGESNRVKECRQQKGSRS